MLGVASFEMTTLLTLAPALGSPYASTDISHVINSSTGRTSISTCTGL